MSSTILQTLDQIKMLFFQVPELPIQRCRRASMLIGATDGGIPIRCSTHVGSTGRVRRSCSSPLSL